MILLGGASVFMAKQFKKELDLYSQISGSRINPKKSKVYSWNYSGKYLGDIARLLGMEAIHVWDSFTYLGAPIFKKGLKATHWTPIIDKIKR